MDSIHLPHKIWLYYFDQQLSKVKDLPINTLNFDVGYWQSIGILIALSLGYRILSLFFLWFSELN
jgi:hypothetical protein